MVAEAAEVSRTVASMALNGKPGVAAQARARVQAAAQRLGYEPDPIALELRTRRSPVIGLLVCNIANPYFNDILSGMQQVGTPRGIVVITMDSGHSEDVERRHIRYLVSRRVSGLAIAPVGEAAAVEEWRPMGDSPPVVLLNSSMKARSGIDHVAPDPQAVDLAFEHLWGLGHRLIGFLSAPHSLASDRDRLHHYRELCRRHGVPELTLHTELNPAAIESRIVAAFDEPEPPTAVITNSDWSAQHVYLALRSRGLEPGRDLSVVGHDDLTSSALLWPPLTTIAVDRTALGAEAMNRLLGDAAGDYLAPVRLIERGSTRPPAGTGSG